MTDKLQHWKKLDHIVFLCMVFPILGGIIGNAFLELNNYENLGIFIVAGVIWAGTMIIDQLEEH